MEQKGYFITFEGGEGAGKSTLINRLYTHLSNKQVSVLKAHEPGDTEVGKHIRQILLQKNQLSMIGKAELLLYLADRSEHVKSVILPALEKGNLILCDRYNDSTRAYQGAARQIDSEKVESLCHFATDGLEPEITFYLDIDPEIGLKRIKKSTLDRIERENLAFHQRVREGFLTLAKKYPQRITLIDANKSPDAIYQEALSQIVSRCRLN